MTKLRLKRGDILRLEGLLSLQVEEGKVLISGGLHEKGSKILIPKAKSLPLEAEEDAVIDYSLGEGGHIEHLSERTIPPEWDALIRDIVDKRPRLVMVMGNVDVGKTFFTTYVANTLLRHGIRVAAVDGDVGQADIGPPSTVGVGLFERPVGLLYEIPMLSAYFVGSMSPSGHMLEFIVGMARMVERGLRKAEMVIVNTPGWIFGGPARSLQLHLVELLKPDIVVALQQDKELEHLLACIPQTNVRRIPASKSVRPRSRDERAFLRELLLGRYFNNAGRLVLDLRRVRLERCYYRTGQPIDRRSLGIREPILHAEKLPEGLLVVAKRALSQDAIRELKERFEQVKVIEAGSERDLLVGLVDETNELLGLGIVERIDYSRERMTVITPVRDGNMISAVQIGSMKVKPSGKEVGVLRPGSF